MSRFSRSVVLGIVLLMIFLASVSPIYSQSQVVIVERRDGEISIQRDGGVEVRETWQVEYIGGPFTFAFRSIPLKGVTAITNWSVSEDGQEYEENDSETPNTFNVRYETNEVTARWHYPETTDGERTFIIGYVLHGSIHYNDFGDEFYWKFIETDRQYTINSSHVRLSLPSTVQTSQLRLRTYLDGQETSEGRLIEGDVGSTIEFVGGPFPPGAEWEIRAQFPNSVFHSVEQETTEALPLLPTTAQPTEATVERTEVVQQVTTQDQQNVSTSISPVLVAAALMAVVVIALGLGFTIGRKKQLGP